MRSQELAYLANTIVAGCSIQARPFTRRGVGRAVAVCNLGLENCQFTGSRQRNAAFFVVEAGTMLPDDFLVGHDLFSVSRSG